MDVFRFTYVCDSSQTVSNVVVFIIRLFAQELLLSITSIIIFVDVKLHIHLDLRCVNSRSDTNRYKLLENTTEIKSTQNVFTFNRNRVQFSHFLFMSLNCDFIIEI